MPTVGRAAAVRTYLRSPLARGLIRGPARGWLTASAPVLLGLRR